MSRSRSSHESNPKRAQRTIALVFLPVFLSFACELSTPQGLSASQRETPFISAPRDVTAQTLNSPAALAALEAPGIVVFEDGFESQASLAKYFEIRGLDAGKVTLVVWYDDVVLSTGYIGPTQTPR